MKHQFFRHGRRWAKPIDQSTTAQAVRGPGMDPRQWISYGVVTAGNETDEIVVFDEDEGQPLVRVLLEPTKIPVYARVAFSFAGNGEGEWHPYVQGDEVLLAIPEGNERQCVIIGRLCNGIDKFPMASVAGQDPTTNSFAFRRRRTPLIEEVNGPILFRSAMSEALFSIDTAGNITIRDGQRSVFQMSPDVIGLQGPSDSSTPPDVLLQLNLTNRQFTLQMGDAVLNLSASDATPEPNNFLGVAGTMTVSAAGNAATEHVMTAEAFWHCLQHALHVMGAAITALGAAPLTGAALGPLFAIPATTATLTAAATAAGAAPSLLAAAVAAAFAAQPPKTPAVPQVSPGLGSAGFLTG